MWPAPDCNCTERWYKSYDNSTNLTFDFPGQFGFARRPSHTRKFRSELQDFAVGVQCSGEIKQVALEAEGDVVGQFGDSSEAVAVAGLGGGGEDVLCGGLIKVTGHFGGIGDAVRLEVVPERIAQGAGGKGVLVGGLIVGAAADEQEIFGRGLFDVISGGAEVQEGADKDGLSVGAGTQGAGAVGGGHDDGFAGDGFAGEFARGIAEVEFEDRKSTRLNS